MMNNFSLHRVALAPMLGLTDRHFRYLLRLISRHIFLYTGMVTTHALLRGDHQSLLAFHQCEHPVALQLSGDDPKALACCAKMAEKAGYDEINFNVGCPSSRAQAGNFGASLMRNLRLVVDCLKAMQDAVSIPVTAKTRLGIHGEYDEKSLFQWIEKLVSSNITGVMRKDEMRGKSERKIGVYSTINEDFERAFNKADRFSRNSCIILHARGVDLTRSPKRNRSQIKLNYEFVYRAKEKFPACEIVINGDIKTIDEIKTHLQYVDGVMLGRAIYRNPYLLATVDAEFFDDHHVVLSEQEVFGKYCDYMEKELSQGTKLHHMAKHLLGLFHGRPGVREYRRKLTSLINNPSNLASLECLISDC